jgi:hypothetical protein
MTQGQQYLAQAEEAETAPASFVNRNRKRRDARRSSVLSGTRQAGI